MKEWYGNQIDVINKNITLSIIEIILLIICFIYMIKNDMLYFKSYNYENNKTIGTINEVIIEE